MMKTVFIGVSVLVVLGLLALGFFFWSLRRNEDRTLAAIDKLKTQFPVGSSPDGIARLAYAEGAKEFQLQELLNEKDPKVLVSASENPMDLQPDFKGQFEKLNSELPNILNGRIIIIFPGFMLQRWVVKFEFSNHQITKVDQHFID
jgi:hypothetical protein